jgi:uncharacterized repeat protein (TIGR03803 family)
MSTGGALTVLHEFDMTDGSYPYGGLIQASNGNFYGTCTAGGATDFGTIFEVTPAGALTTLHSFDETDGGEPYGGVIQGSDGNFYGTTWAGGTNGWGTVFMLTSAC